MGTEELILDIGAQLHVGCAGVTLWAAVTKGSNVPYVGKLYSGNTDGYWIYLRKTMMDNNETEPIRSAHWVALLTIAKWGQWLAK